jgi:hypothetical protein
MALNHPQGCIIRDGSRSDYKQGGPFIKVHKFVYGLDGNNNSLESTRDAGLNKDN